MINLLDKQIAIIGGGPGGLTLARLLQMRGANIRVYERDLHKDARPKGATLDLHYESGLLALREAGLMDAFLISYRPGADQMKIMGKHGEILWDEAEVHQPAAAPEVFNEYSRPEIDRGPLQEILLNSLTPGTVTWDSQFVDMKPHGDQWNIHFRNGLSVKADLVVGADGASSRIRSYITPIRPFYSGVTVIQGSVPGSARNTPQLHQLVNNGKIFALADSQSMVLSSKGDGSLDFYCAFNKPEAWSALPGFNLNDRNDSLRWFKNEFSGWDPLWHELFLHSDPPLIMRPQYCVPADQDWKSLSNLTIIGDAAHLMPPFAGEGVNMAMLDAVELMKVLTNHNFSTLHEAILDYETSMRERAAEVIKQTMLNTRELHAPGAAKFLVDIMSGAI